MHESNQHDVHRLSLDLFELPAVWNGYLLAIIPEERLLNLVKVSRTDKQANKQASEQAATKTPL